LVFLPGIALLTIGLYLLNKVAGVKIHNTSSV